MAIGITAIGFMVMADMEAISRQRQRQEMFTAGYSGARGKDNPRLLKAGVWLGLGGGRLC